MSKHAAESDRLTLSPYVNTITFRMILISFFLITDRERNIAHKDRGTCYKKYSVQIYDLYNNCSYKILTWHFSGSLKCILEMEHDLFPTD